MLKKKLSTEDQTNTAEDSLNVLRPAKESAKFIICNGVKIKGEIIGAADVQIDGNAEVTINSADNLVVGITGNLKGKIISNNINVSGKLEGKINAIGTLTVQDFGSVSGNIEYQNMQIKLGGEIRGKIKVSNKIKKFSDYKKNDKK